METQAIQTRLNQIMEALRMKDEKTTTYPSSIPSMPPTVVKETMNVFNDEERKILKAEFIKLVSM